jgi:hypothetical protein
MAIEEAFLDAAELFEDLGFAEGDAQLAEHADAIAGFTAGGSALARDQVDHDEADAVAYDRFSSPLRQPGDHGVAVSRCSPVGGFIEACGRQGDTQQLTHRMAAALVPSSPGLLPPKTPDGQAQAQAHAIPTALPTAAEPLIGFRDKLAFVLGCTGLWCVVASNSGMYENDQA